MTAKFGTGPYGRTVYSAGSPIEITGTMAVNVGFAAALNNALAVSGELPIVPIWKGERLNGDFVLSGEMEIAVVLPASSIFAGPLWGQDALCQGQWGPDTLCADPGWTRDPDIPVNSPWAPSELCDG